jgi:hypothetical protein
MKYLRRAASGSAGNGLAKTIKYLRHTMSGAAGTGLVYCSLVYTPYKQKGTTRIDFGSGLV